MTTATVPAALSNLHSVKTTPLERRRLSLYKQAILQRHWAVADHLLSAIEVCSGHDAQMSDAVAQACCALVAVALTAREAPATESGHGP